MEGGASLAPTDAVDEPSLLAGYTPPNFQDLRTLFQRTEIKQATKDTRVPTNGVMDIETIISLGLATGLAENEKEALLEMNVKEKDELATVVGARAVEVNVEPGRDVADVITQF